MTGASSGVHVNIASFGVADLRLPVASVLAASFTASGILPGVQRAIEFAKIVFA